MDQRWQVDLDQMLGLPRGLISLMAIIQQNKWKVRPVTNYRELNQYIEAYTADDDVCASKTWEWRHKGSDLSLLDLRKAYLQMRVDETLWCFVAKGSLTRLGFGLNVVPKIMKTTLSAVLSKE